MKKRVLCCIAVLTLISAMTACGKKENVNDVAEETTEESTEVSTEETSTATLITETTTAEDIITTTKPASEQAKAVSKPAEKKPTSGNNGGSTNTNAGSSAQQNNTNTVNPPAAESLGVTVKGKKILLNTKISDSTSALGNTTDYSEAPSCNYDGLDKVFTYGDVSIYTYPHASGDLINEIEVNDASVSTDKGIAPIGKTLAEIKGVYGEPTSTEGDTYKYKSGNSYTYFYVDGDVVSYWGVAYEA